MKREEAIEVVNGLWRNEKEREAFGVLIPELRESEDERTRKSIIAFLRAQKFVPNNQADILNVWIAYLEKQKEQKPAEWSEEDENVIETLIRELRINAQFEFAVRKSGLDYINTLTALDKCRRLYPQSKQKWSEEDEKKVNDIIYILAQIPEQEEAGDMYPSALIEWLKSLRPQPHWKPSEEQMVTLERSLEHLEEEDFDILESLYNDLKKL